MERRWQDIPMEELRGAVQAYAERASYRMLAERVSLSPHALMRFVQGTALPQDRTRRKVADWYLRFRLEQRPLPAHHEEMPGAAGDVPIEQLREAAYGAARESSVRRIAREVGMSPTGLAGFLSGETRSTSRTRRKLTQWYLRSHDG